MKPKRTRTILAMGVVLTLCFVGLSAAEPLGTVFTYQGRLIDANSVADGLYDFEFKVYDANVAGTQKGSTIDVNELDVIDGQFTALLDFGSDIFTGDARWLEVGVRAGELEDPNVYTVLSPRQKVTPTPYALYALNGGGAGGSPWQVNGTSIYYNNGNVGIGTANPAQNLEVEGGVFIDHSGGAHVPAEQGIALTVDGRAGKNILRLRDSEANTAMVVNHVGKVGIGTSSPTAKLEVNGQVRITDGSQGAGKVLTSDAGGQASWQSPTETDPTVLASVKDGISWSEVSAIPAGFADGIDDVGAGDNLGNHTATQNILLNGYWLSGDGGSEGVYVANNGNVGIGEANPVARLVVGQGGDILLKAAGEDAGDIIFQKSTGTQKGRIFTAPEAGQNKLYLTSGDSNPDITIDPNGNVGIGTTSPAQKLHVSGSAQFDKSGPEVGRLTLNTVARNDPGRYGIVFANNLLAPFLGDDTQDQIFGFLTGWSANRVYSARLQVYGKASGSWGRRLGMTHDGDNGIIDTDFGHIVLNPAGNVGIGTTNPTAKLEVNGTIKTTTICETDAITTEWAPVESSRAWQSVAMSADGTIQTAVVYLGQIYVSTDSGNTWTVRESDRNWRSVAMSADGTKQTATVYGGQIYVSTNSGNTWTAKESNRGWISVAMSANGTKRTAVVLGGQIYVSTDSGNTWTAKESDRFWQTVAMSADGTKQTAVVNTGQIYVSTDSGNTWTAKESNRVWRSVAMSADGTKQTAVVNGGQIYVSTDSGNTWIAKESSRDWESVAMSADGTKQTAVVHYGQIYISTDSGNTWAAKESDRQWRSVAMSADGTKQTAVGWSGQIYISGSLIGVGIGTTTPAGKLDVNGSIYQRGAMLHADYVFEPGYKLESIDEHSEFMWQEKHLPAMPKMQKDENGQEMVEIGARSRGIVEELEKAHIYIEQLHKNVNQLQEQNKKLQERISAMETITNELAAGQKAGAR